MKISVITVHARTLGDQLGWLSAGPLWLACALGRGGRRALKCEGDGATPIGAWPMRRVLYRADRVARPRTLLPVSPIGPNDGWCDDPRDRNYNRPVRLPYPAGHEQMWRKDHLYDLVVVLGYNDGPRSRGRGSAIFMHLAAPDFAPTAGCIALREADLRSLLAIAGPHTVMRITG
jgi:L,D-peptidoglycan transpeptidase YkuD (ErfK/YbiS/YcfS/YnhG family)